MENSGIQWTTHTFNPWIGCTKVSPACDFCYAEKGSARLGAQHKLNLWNGDRFFTSDAYWRQPLSWNRKAKDALSRPRVFCASYSDVFEDRPELRATRQRLQRLIEDTPYLDWLLLTKRPENAMRLLDWGWTWPLNVWLGATCESQEWLDKRMGDLLAAPAAVRFISYEPALGPIDLAAWLKKKSPLHWVICGGESGPHARPFDLAWARDVQSQCRIHSVAFFMKQLGRRPISRSDDDRRHVGDMNLPSPFTLKLADSHGGDDTEWPEDLRVRQSPPWNGLP